MPRVTVCVASVRRICPRWPARPNAPEEGGAARAAPPDACRLLLQVLEGVQQVGYIGYAKSGGLVIAGAGTVEPVVTLLDIPQRCVAAVVAAGGLDEIQGRVQQPGRVDNARAYRSLQSPPPGHQKRMPAGVV